MVKSMRFVSATEQMKRQPHPILCLLGLLIGLAGFIALAGEAWPEIKVAMSWHSGTAIVTGFGKQGRQRLDQENLTIVFVRTSLPDGRELSGFTANDQWRLRNWPREAIPTRLGDRLAVYVDPSNLTRVLPKEEVDPIGTCLFALFCGLGVIRFGAGLVRWRHSLDKA